MYESSDDIWQTVDAWQRQIDLSYANSGLHSIIGAFDCNTSISNDAAIVPADDAPATGSCTPFVTKRSQQHSILFAVSIPWPSGIIVEENVFPTAVGHVIRSVSLQYSAVSVRRQWAVVYTLPLFTQEECDRFISAAEAFGTSIGGWGRSHNTRDELPSVDLPVGEVLGAEAAAELRSYIDSSVLLAMAQSFGLDHRSLQLRCIILLTCGHMFMSLMYFFLHVFQRYAHCQV